MILVQCSAYKYFQLEPNYYIKKRNEYLYANSKSILKTKQTGTKSSTYKQTQNLAANYNNSTTIHTTLSIYIIKLIQNLK